MLIFRDAFFSEEVNIVKCHFPKPFTSLWFKSFSIWALNYFCFKMLIISPFNVLSFLILLFNRNGQICKKKHHISLNYCFISYLDDSLDNWTSQFYTTTMKLIRYNNKMQTIFLFRKIRDQNFTRCIHLWRTRFWLCSHVLLESNL